MATKTTKGAGKAISKPAAKKTPAKKAPAKKTAPAKKAESVKKLTAKQTKSLEKMVEATSSPKKVSEKAPVKMTVAKENPLMEIQSAVMAAAMGKDSILPWEESQPVAADTVTEPTRANETTDVAQEREIIDAPVRGNSETYLNQAVNAKRHRDTPAEGKVSFKDILNSKPQGKRETSSHLNPLKKFF